MYDSVLMNAAHTQAEPLNGDATRLYEALGVVKYVLLQLCLDAKYKVGLNQLRPMPRGVIFRDI